MGRAGASARQRSEQIRATQMHRLRRRWPLVVLAVAVAFVLGFYLPRLLVAAVSSLLVGLAPDSGGLKADVPFVMSLAFGGFLAGGATFGLLRRSRSELAWRKGASGERRVGRVLDSLQESGVRTLHDRKMPNSPANIDHVVVSPVGVFTVETKSYDGRLEVRARGSQLWINGRNRSSMMSQARQQADAVRAVLNGQNMDIPTYPMLCFVGTSLPLLFPPREIAGVVVCTPRSLTRRLQNHPIRLSEGQVMSVQEALDDALG